MTDPTRILGNGLKEWRLPNGKLHRVDGPAVELPNGTLLWVQGGKLHRVDGPAVEWGDGGKEWWLNDVQMDSLEHFVKVQEMLHG